jgi:uncharacterized membrane protein YhaH (DUF805 family)
VTAFRHVAAFPGWSADPPRLLRRTHGAANGESNIMNWYFEALRKYATFRGRARRKEYWMFALVNFVIVVVLMILGAMLGAASPKAAITINVVLAAYVLLILVPSIAVMVRRLHDINRSGWWFWIQLVPLAGPIILFVFTVMDGTPGQNAFGPSPKAT